MGGETRETIAAQAIAVTARNFLASLSCKMDFFAPTSRGHRCAQQLLTAGFTRFQFLFLRGNRFRGRSHD
jgi:hypothetical protein